MRNFIRLLAVIIILTYSHNIGFGQEMVHQFQDNYNLVSSDPVGNFYLVNNERINKIDSTGKVLYTYANPDRGYITHLDASDPFRILVYYRDYNLVVFLDRTLSQLGESIKLDNLDIYNPSGMAKSSQGGFWLIDASSNSLLQIGRDLEKIVELRISGLSEQNDEGWYPLTEWKERLYICDPGIRTMQFDLFGMHLKSIPIKAFRLSVSEGKLLLVTNSSIYSIDNFPGALAEEQKTSFSAWEDLLISRNHALMKSHSLWSLFRLKKTF